MNADDVIRNMMAIKAVSERCRREFFYFVQTFWEVVIREPPVYNWHIPYLCKELETLSASIIRREPKPYDLIINIPPGTTKSTLVTVMWPAWLWTLDPTLRIITNSYSGGLSVDHAIKSKDIITSDNYRLLFPEVRMRKDKSGKQHYQNTEGGFRYATSTGATITGFHGHLIINDDPQNPKMADSAPLRQTANQHTATLSSRKVDKANTPVVTIMQRLHTEDVTGYLLQNKADKIRHICLPAEDCDRVRPAELRERYVDGLLDPVRLGRDVLEEAVRDLGSQGYAGQYMQSPVVEGGNIVKDEWFQRISLADFHAVRHSEPMQFYLDTAYNKKTSSGNDPSGIIAACKVGKNIYVYHAQQIWKEMPDLLRFLPGYMSAHLGDRRSRLSIEPKANGVSVVQMLREVSELNVRMTPTPKDGKDVRLRAVSPRIECGRVFLVEGTWNEMFLSEVCGFPNMPHDEFVDVLGYAINDLYDEDNDDYGWVSTAMFR